MNSRYIAAMNSGPFTPPELPEYNPAGHDHGHPVVAGLAAAAGSMAVRYYAGAYLDRTQGPGTGRRFFSQLTMTPVIAVLGLTAALILAFFVAYASVGLSLAIALIAVIITAAIVVPPLFRAIGYAIDEFRYRQQIARDRSPRVF